MTIRYILLEIIFGIAYILGLFIYPIAYIFRVTIRKYHILPIWWFLNNGLYGKDNDYGYEFWHIQNGYSNISEYSNLKKFWISYRWNAFRNSHWNLKLAVKPKQGEMKSIKIYTNTTDKDGTVFCNYDIFGKQYCTYEVGGTKYFRY